MGQVPESGAGESPELKAMRSGPDLEKRFPLALAAFAVLAALVWFTMDPAKVLVFGKPVDLRLVPLLVIGGLAFRTWLALQADRIRRRSEAERNQGSGQPGVNA